MRLQFSAYRFLIRRFRRSSHPVVVRDVRQDAVDAEVGPAGKHSLALRAVFGLVPPPVATEAGQAEAVSTRYGYRLSEDVFTQRAQEVLLREETDGGGHFLKFELKPHLICFSLTFALRCCD